MKRMWGILAVTSTSASDASAKMSPGPAALLLLVCLMAVLISLNVDGPTSIKRFVGAASMLGEFSGVGQFKSFSKCFSHLFCYSLMLVITSPSLLFTGRSGVR
ncbi:unnamed protein product [Schistosoma mattheei]|uniref:Uncharacterized protein n=1 Tax=Schistosoma mattheei TaxID=31246 RepID=A0A3P8EAW9_9TREM|nr:unnamed protein product [Schistosoma mattheei]